MYLVMIMPICSFNVVSFIVCIEILFCIYKVTKKTMIFAKFNLLFCCFEGLNLCISLPATMHVGIK